jgi:hypothetical protein
MRWTPITTSRRGRVVFRPRRVSILARGGVSILARLRAWWRDMNDYQTYRAYVARRLWKRLGR